MLTPIARARRALVAAHMGCAVAFGIMLSATPVCAQGYPGKTIKLVVPFGPGGPTDVSARLVSQVVQAALGQSIVIENRPGAGGATGTKSVAAAEPDGYTLLIGTSATLGVVPALVKSPGYDPLRSFAPVAKVADSTLVLVAPASFPATTVQAFVAYAKQNPGKLSYASAGAGNQTQLLAELFKSKAGIDVQHVPYKSGAEMVTAVLGDQVQMGFPDISILLPLIRERKLKALAVTSAARHPQLPDVPTMVESGIADFIMTFWTGVIAPAGTPASVIDKLNAAINDGLKSEAMRDTLAKVGATINPGSPQDFSRFIAAETAKWAAVAKTAGIAAE
jgi:tripartite-type tricarboxylate transporter receptor subunit TctC